MVINWFNKTIFIPFEIGIPLLIIFLVLVFFISYRILRKAAKKIYVCTECGHGFNVSTVQLFTLHFGELWRLKCPKCGKVSYCSRSYNQEE